MWRRTEPVSGTDDVHVFPCVKPVKFRQQLINNVHFVSTLDTQSQLDDNHIHTTSTYERSKQSYDTIYTVRHKKLHHCWFCNNLIKLNEV